MPARPRFARPAARGRHCVMVLAAGIAVAGAAIQPAVAQPPPAVAGARPVSLAPLPVAERDALARAVGREAGRGTRVAQHAAVGALGGAAVGVFLAFAVTHEAHVTDHSEDGLAYMVFVPAGAAVGALMGTIVGVLNTR